MENIDNITVYDDPFALADENWDGLENMTNDQIIQEETKRLRQLGKIGKHEEINTYDFWKNLGMTPRQEAPITRLKMKNSMGYYCWKSFWSTSQISC